MSSKATVLFVDDEENIVNTLRMLCKSKFNVYTATSGAKALEIIKNNQIQVIVSDQRMPEMQGIELLREVRQASPHTMRIMLTGYADLAAIIGSINDGEIYRYIYKPWSNKDVVDTIEAAANTAMALAADAAENKNDAPTDSQWQPGILVIDDDKEVYHAVEKLFSGRCKVSSASSCDDALGVLDREQIAVIVSDVFVGRQDVTPFIKVLKEQHPGIVTVVLTKFNDANMVVGLINHGQVFRFLGKPFHQAQLRVSVDAALLYYAKLRQRPRLLSRHRVDKLDTATAGINPGFATMLMTRLRALRSPAAAAR
jgi:DNA-binding NtrC family response regulator